MIKVTELSENEIEEIGEASLITIKLTAKRECPFSITEWTA